MSCAICHNRKPRRHCIGIHADICTVCCGTEREETVSCPIECEYLQEAYRHERVESPDPATLPNRDIQVTEEFLRDNEMAVVIGGRSLLKAALEVDGAVDFDLREALDSLMQTYRTLGSGLYYEARPQNAIAAAICDSVQQTVREFRELEAKEQVVGTMRDATILGVLCFLQRMECDWNNGRKRGRAFVNFLAHQFMPTEKEGEGDEPAPPLLIG